MVELRAFGVYCFVVFSAQIEEARSSGLAMDSDYLLLNNKT